MSRNDGSLWLTRLDDMPPSLHLTHQANLDALDADDRVSTGRLDPGRDVGTDPLLDTCGQLIDHVYDWWDGLPPPVVYRARTSPDGRSVAFTETANVAVLDARPLRDATALMAHLVMRAGFSIPSEWLERASS